MRITIVIPCYRSEKTLEDVVKEAKAEILKREGNDYQFVLVNDCSPDDTFGVIKKLCAEDNKIVGLDLGRNYGQNNARLAAVPYIEGDVAVCIDDDGQHPADQIYTLVDKVTEGYDLVYANFKTKKVSLFRRVVSKWNTAILDITGAKMKGITNSPFLAWSRFSIDALKEYTSPFPSAGAYLMKCTTRVVNVDVEQRARKEGHSGYTLKKLLNLWLTGVTNFSAVPLRLSFIFCVLAMICCIGFAITAIVVGVLGSSLVMWFVAYALLSLFFSILFFLVTLLGEYIGKIYMTISKQPSRVVRTAVNADIKS